MSRDFNENTEDTSHVEQLSKEHDTSNLSDYSTSFSIMLLNSLSYKLTNPGGQLMKLTHTQCDLPMCRI